MHYVLDTGFFIGSREYHPNTFRSFWKNLDEMVMKGKVSSVIEVRRELENYGGEQDHILEWIEQNEHIFTEPSEEEQDNVRKIFNISNFKNLIGKNKLMGKDPFADPFVIGKAMTGENRTLVSREKPARKDKNGNVQGAPKIPDVCNYFDVRCIMPRQFMEEQKWSF